MQPRASITDDHLTRLQVEQSRFLVPPFTLSESVFVGETRPREHQQQSQAEPGEEGGTRSMLAHLRYPPNTNLNAPVCSSTLQKELDTCHRSQ